MKWSFTGGETNKVWGHIHNYIFPFLTQDVQTSIIKILRDNKYYKVRDTIIPQNGEFYNTDYSHVMGLKYDGLDVGDQIKIVDLRIVLIKDKPKCFAITSCKRQIPLIKIDKPKNLKRTNSSEGAFAVETQIAKNLGGEAAGAGKHIPDFSCSLNIIRGESKFTDSKMGQGKVRQIDGRWEISSGSQEVDVVFKQIEVDGEPLTCYLDRTYPDGVIPKGFSTKPKSGTAGAYLQSTRANVLHVHDKKRLAGTSLILDTNEINCSLYDRNVSLGRITVQDIAALDGSVCIENTQNGDTTAVHRPRAKKMRELAARGPIDLHNPDDAKKIMKELKCTV